jgi:excisionase family DNA binding protein
MQRSTDQIKPLLFSVPQVAKLIGFSRTKTYELVQARKIPSILVEGKTRVTRAALEAWIGGQPHR